MCSYMDKCPFVLRVNVSVNVSVHLCLYISVIFVCRCVKRVCTRV